MKWKIRLLILSTYVVPTIGAIIGSYFVCNWQSAFVGLLIGAGSLLYCLLIKDKVEFYQWRIEHKRYEEGNDLR